MTQRIKDGQRQESGEPGGGATRFRRALRALSAGFCLLFLLSCESTDRGLLLVSVSQLPAGIQAVHVTATVGGLRTEQDVTESPAHFALWLPARARGPLTIEVKAINQDGCSPALGEATATIEDTAQTKVVVALMDLPVPLCPIVVERAADVSDTTSVVISAPATINCGEVCSGFLPQGTVVELTAAADPTLFFAGWSGDCTGRKNTCRLTLQRSVHVGASFVPYLLNVHAVGVVAGIVSNPVGIDCSPTCTAQFNKGTSVTLTATPPSDDVVALWSGACNGYGPCQVQLGEPQEVSVRFVPNTVTVIKYGGAVGRVTADRADLDCGAQCSLQVPVGTKVKLTAQPQPGAFFNGWPLPCEAQGPTCTLTVKTPVQVTAPFVGASSCVAGQFCLEQPLPIGSDLRSLWAASPTDLWAVGNTGVLHWDSSRSWSEVPLDRGTGATYAVWGSGARDVWVAGDMGAVWRWNGTSWSSTATHTTKILLTLWGSAANDVWAGGIEGTAIHWDGSDWTSFPLGFSAIILQMWGSGPKDVWAVGQQGLLAHWDGDHWSLFSTSIVANFNSIWGSSASDVWIVGDSGTLLRWDGKALRIVNSGVTTRLFAVHGTGPTDVWLGGGSTLLHWDGNKLTSLPTKQIDILSLLALARDDVWLGGRAGQIAHWDGSDFALASSNLTSEILYCVFGSGPDDAWAVGDAGVILRRHDGSWKQVDSGTTETISGVWASSANDAWATPDASYFLHWNGTSWQPVPKPDSTYLNAIWGSGPNDVWAVGDDATLHWDGTAWAVDPSASAFSLQAVWGSGPKDVWAVGDDLIVHWNGTTWSSMTSPSPNPLYGIGGSGPNDVWATGFRGTIIHWNGTTWSLSPTGSQAFLFGISAISPVDAWAVGGFGATLHWDGTSWQTLPNIPSTTLYSIWSDPSGLLRMVGANGQLLSRHL